MRYLLCLLLLTAAVSSTAQEREFLREGNRLYKEKKYDSASICYLAAASGKPDYAAAWFNLGNSEAQQGKHQKALEAYNSAIANTQEKQLKANAYYGMGNTFAAEKKWREAAQAYRQSLRLSPADTDTKYNYSYALSQLRQQEQREQQRQNKQQNQQNKQKKNDPQQQNNQQKNKGNGPPPDKGPEGSGEQPRKSKLSKEQADNILNALQQDEQKLQREQGKGQPVQASGSGKDW